MHVWNVTKVRPKLFDHLFNCVVFKFPQCLSSSFSKYFLPKRQSSIIGRTVWCFNLLWLTLFVVTGRPCITTISYPDELFLFSFLQHPLTLCVPYKSLAWFCCRTGGCTCWGLVLQCNQHAGGCELERLFPCERPEGEAGVCSDARCMKSLEE